MSSSPPRLPPEILLEIISSLCGEYIDELIAEGHERRTTVWAVDFSDSEIDDEQTDKQDLLPDCTESNPVVALLRSTYQLREVTLTVLSEGLEVPRGCDGRLTVKPWSIIHPLRRVHAMAVRDNLVGMLDLLGEGTPTIFACSYFNIALLPIKYRLEMTFPEDGDEQQKGVHMPMLRNLGFVARGLKPEAFGAPVRRRVGQIYWSVLLVTRLEDCKKKVISACDTFVCSYIEGYTKAYRGLKRALHRMGTCEPKLSAWKSTIVSTFGTYNFHIGYEVFQVAKVEEIVEAVEQLEGRLQSKHYNECKQLVNEVLDFWAKIYPQLEWTWYDEEEAQLSEEFLEG